jgi:hypothetical protein
MEQFANEIVVGAVTAVMGWGLSKVFTNRRMKALEARLRELEDERGRLESEPKQVTIGPIINIEYLNVRIKEGRVEAHEASGPGSSPPIPVRQLAIHDHSTLSLQAADDDRGGSSEEGGS